MKLGFVDSNRKKRDIKAEQKEQAA